MYHISIFYFKFHRAGGLDSTHWEWRPMAIGCEDGNETSVYVTGVAEQLSASKEVLCHIELTNYMNCIRTSRELRQLCNPSWLAEGLRDSVKQTYAQNCPKIVQIVCHNIVTCMCDCRRGLNWWTDFLTTYTHVSELYAITATLLNSTIHKSPQHSQSRPNPAVSSLAVSWQRLLTVEILQLHTLKFSLHRLPYRTDFFAPIMLLINPRQGPIKKTTFPKVPLLLLIDSLLWERVYRAVA
jgi:hypothetical protein